MCKFDIIKILNNILKTSNIKINEENLDLIENYWEIFENIPDDKIKYELSWFIQLMVNYESHKIFDIVYETIKNDKHQKKIKPITKIKSSINKLEKHLEHILSLLGCDEPNAELIIEKGKKLSLLEEMYVNTKKVIDDLKNSEFKIVKKTVFYEPKYSNKTELKEFFSILNDKYQLNKTRQIKNFIDSL